jgi:hypothetical protein
MGERFVMCELRDEDRVEAALRAVANRYEATARRAEIAKAVQYFVNRFVGVAADSPPPLPEGRVAKIANLADFVALARSPVGRDGHRRDVLRPPRAEAPARLAKQLATFATAAGFVGLDDAAAWDLTERIAWDSVPPTRRHLLRYLTANDSPRCYPGRVADAIRVSKTSVVRTAEDLQLLGLVFKPPLGSPLRLREHPYLEMLRA